MCWNWIPAGLVWKLMNQFVWRRECATSQIERVDVFDEFIMFYSFNSTFWESVCRGSSSSMESTVLVLDEGLVGSLDGLLSPSGLRHAGISCEEWGPLDSSSSEVRLWSLMSFVMSCSFCLSCCSSRSTPSHWGRGELLFGVREAWLVNRNTTEIMSRGRKAQV